MQTPLTIQFNMETANVPTAISPQKAVEVFLPGEAGFLEQSLAVKSENVHTHDLFT